MSNWRLPAHCLAVALGMFLLLPGGALACSLDGIASLSVDGRPASLSGGGMSGGLPTWAPFTLDASAPGALLHFAEDLAKVRRTLPAAAFVAPFRWTFGDGETGTGRSATHRYARAGQYTVSVSYYWPSRRRWVEFDRAEEAILPAGVLWHPRARPAGVGSLLGRLGPPTALAAGGLLLAARMRPKFRGRQTAPWPGSALARGRPYRITRR